MAIKELKRLDLTKPRFKANGVHYNIEGGLSIERFCMYQILEKEAGFGVSFKSVFTNLQKLHSLMNNVKFVEAAILLDNMMRGVAKLEEKQPTLLKMCALFINADDEDRSTISEDMIAKKINDWKAEYDVRDFFQVALNTMDGFLEIYNNVSQIISENKDQE